MLDIKEAVLSAEKKIRPHVRETLLDQSVALSRMTGVNVFLKCENTQYTGSFKVRGALNKLLSLTPQERTQGVVTASSGNHGAAVAFGLKKLDIPGIVFVPETASPAKVDNIRNYDAKLEFFGDDCMKTEMHAHHYAKEHKMIYVSPYNDRDVIAGQGTIGLELTRQLAKIDVVLVAIGGGGLISGISGFLKSASPNTQIIGCLPENSPVMSASVAAGHVVEMETKPTISDATAGGIEEDSMTFEICQTCVDDYILVSEDEIKDAIVTAAKLLHFVIEGASGVALAALLKNAERFKGKNVVVVLSGANISLELFKKILLDAS